MGGSVDLPKALPALGLVWQSSRFSIDLSIPRVMGIVNITPDSFFDGGHHASPGSAIAHAEQLLKEGADILDIGGESSRPGADFVSAEQEWVRIEPFLQQAVHWGVPLSVDTCKPDVMQRALAMGVDIINDIWAMRQPGAVKAVAQHPRCGICLMHMHAEPATMQLTPMQGAAMAVVHDFLQHRAQDLVSAGVSSQRIVLDPGIGFGKTVAQNFELLAQQADLLQLGLPLLVGWSRKSSLGVVTQSPVDQRLVPSIAAAVLAMERGARILRVHDVSATVAARQVWLAAQQIPTPHQEAQQ